MEECSTKRSGEKKSELGRRLVTPLPSPFFSLPLKNLWVPTLPDHNESEGRKVKTKIMGITSTAFSGEKSAKGQCSEVAGDKPETA